MRPDRTVTLFGGTLAKKNVAALDRRSFDFDPRVVRNFSQRGGVLARRPGPGAHRVVSARRRRVVRQRAQPPAAKP
jgi:hypothetical protein